MYFREEIDKMREASFDFGKKPPVDGYTKVTEKSVYTKEKGFGLSEVAEADERKIGEKERILISGSNINSALSSEFRTMQATLNPKTIIKTTPSLKLNLYLEYGLREELKPLARIVSDTSMLSSNVIETSAEKLSRLFFNLL